LGKGFLSIVGKGIGKGTAATRATMKGKGVELSGNKLEEKNGG